MWVAINYFSIIRSFHRLITILTYLPLQTNQIIKNEGCECCKFIEACPQNALTSIEFEDHPTCQEDVLDIKTCLGDNGCLVYNYPVLD